MNENIADTLQDLVVDIDQLNPRERNPRRGDVETIKESLTVNGQYRPIVVNQNSNEVLAGNHTLQAAKALGWTKIAATYVNATDEEAARIVLIDNRANDVATYEDSLLLELLKEFEDLKGTGFTNEDITRLMQELGDESAKEGHTDPDEVPDTPEDPKTKLGDVWQLGEHRLICGDSTDPEVVSKVMAGRAADLLLTDPPYGVDYVGGTKDKLTIENDNLKASFLGDFLTDSFSAAVAVLPAGCPVYVFHADSNRPHFQQACDNAGIEVKQCLIWVKQQLVLGRQDYQWRHEPIIYGWKAGASHRWYGGFDKTTVIDETNDPAKMTKDELVELVKFINGEIETTAIHYDRPSRNELHPTIKPVGLLERFVNNSSRYGDAVLDIFAGSGSTLIACERLGRHGYMVELDPAYCDVIIQRWEEHTGNEAVLETPAES